LALISRITKYMTLRTTVKKTAPRRPAKGAIVVVIASPTDLRRAAAMAQPPDLFELRLDHLAPIIAQVERKLSILPAPIIITARHPQEGGANNLSTRERSQLLLRFLPRAKYIDVELRSARALRPLLIAAQKQKVGQIISLHYFKCTPSTRSLRAKLRLAKALGADVFKVATRTDTPSQLARLIDFASRKSSNPAISAMGIGRLGAVSRILLARSGSALNYARLGPSRIEGQLSVEILRSALPR
jgi:3-dehydroquinate dehydratase-1